MRRVLHIWLLVFAFLFIQEAVAVHSASHVAAATHAGDKGLPSDTACQVCIGHASLSGAAPLPVAPTLFTSDAVQSQPGFVLVPFVSRAVVTARARAPPVLS